MSMKTKGRVKSSSRVMVSCTIQSRHPHVIPAKAGIQPVRRAVPKVCPLDSRLRGNDVVWDTPIVQMTRVPGVDSQRREQSWPAAWGVFGDSQALDSSTVRLSNCRNKPGMSMKRNDKVKKSRRVEESRSRESNAKG
jgi:hypothetical protein